jgi:hypothetical protein
MERKIRKDILDILKRLVNTHRLIKRKEIITYLNRLKDANKIFTYTIAVPHDQTKIFIKISEYQGKNFSLTFKL